VDERLRDALLARRDEDQRIRQLASSGGYLGTGELPDDLLDELTRVDQDNTRWLADLLATQGWPNRTLVGEEASRAAWLLAQHADHDPVQQRTFLDAMRLAVEEGEASTADLAYLEDRVRVRAGQQQLYGTQFISIGGGPIEPHPIEDPGQLDERRAQVGLGSFAEYEAGMREMQ
jgi:hypothetical protein